MPEKLSYPLREIELFSSHWDEDWDIVVKNKDNKKGGGNDKEDGGENSSLRDNNKGHNTKGQNDKQNDKEHEGNDNDVKTACRNISKAIGNVMQTSIDQHVNATSQFGVLPSSSPAKPRRRHRFPSNKRGSRGMSAADHVASSPPATFAIHHSHQPIRGRKSYPTRSPTRK
jgi:hypothetical protein